MYTETKKIQVHSMVVAVPGLTTSIGQQGLLENSGLPLIITSTMTRPALHRPMDVTENKLFFIYLFIYFQKDNM